MKASLHGFNPYTSSVRLENCLKDQVFSCSASQGKKSVDFTTVFVITFLLTRRRSLTMVGKLIIVKNAILYDKNWMLSSICPIGAWY